MFSMILCINIHKISIYGINNNKSYPILFLILPCLLFAVIFGCRFNVGVDYSTYYMDYLYNIESREIEFGFLFIKNLFQDYNLHFAFYFGFIAFLQIFFFMLAFRKRAYLYPYIIVALFLSCIELGWMNGIRQSIATCIFVYAITFIDRKEPIKYIIAIIFAMQFHSSAIILFPIYFITYLPILKKRWISIAIYITALFVSTLPVENFDKIFTQAVDILGYSDVYDENALVELDLKGSGLGRLILNTIFLVIILYSNKIKQIFHNDERWFSIIYNLFIIGMFGNIAFNKCVILLRPFGYFRVFWGIMFGILLYYLLKNRTKWNDLIKYFMMSLIILTFIANMINGKSNYMEFHFFWENINN